MARIHKPVAAYQKHLKHRVSNVLADLSVDSPIQRGNWAIFNDLDGPLDLYQPAGFEEREDKNKVTQYHAEKTGTELTFRAEYQTLRRLPKSKAILFTIRTFQRYLRDFQDLPKGDSLALIKAIEMLNPDMASYKGAQFWKDAAVTYLKKCATQRRSKL